MKLISLKGRNIGLLKGEFEFNFDDALTVITGPIGCGKSTLLTMVRASLTNSFPGNTASWASWGTPPQEACYFVATWRIGDKVLHIAKCVSGEKQFAGLNIPRLRIEKDSGEVEEITSSRDALERTLSLIPVPANIIDGHLIVDQDSITAPVAATPAKFKETIHTLTRTDELENIRGSIRDTLGSVTIPDVEEPLKQAEQDVNVDSGEVLKYQKLFEELSNELQAMLIHEVNTRLDELQRIKTTVQRRNELQSQLTTADNIIRQLEQNLEMLQNKKAELELAVESNKADAEESRKILYSADVIIKANNRIAALKKQKTDYAAKLEEYARNTVDRPGFEDPTDEQLDQLNNAINEVKQSLAAVRKKLELSAQGQCPECGNSTEVCETDLQALQTKENDCITLLQELESALSISKANKRAWADYEQKAKRWMDAVAAADAKHEEILQELESLKDTPIMDDSVKAFHNKRAAEYDSYVKSLTKLNNDITIATTHRENQITAKANKQAEFDVLPAETFNEHEHARLTKIVDDHLRLRMRMSEIKGSLENAVKALERSQSRLDAQQKRAAQVEPIRKFRAVLEKAAAVLVKDGLPKLLSLQYMGKLNERLAFYLNMINADFTAFIDDNLEFTARKADGLVHRANRLSGGQKQQASVAYLLAVNDVFASTLGILALDEPSGAMQESNSQELAEAFSYLAKVGKQTNRQFIVITHSASLAAYGCTHIELEGQ